MPTKTKETYQAYCLKLKKKVPLISDIKLTKKKLRNGNTLTLVSGNTKNCGRLTTILSNKKAKK